MELSAFEEAMEEFDFRQVRTIMVLLDWEWHTKKGYKVPSISEMQETCSKLYDLIKDKEDGWVATGGFEVETRGKTVTIKFVLEESSSYSYDEDLERIEYAE
jgi:hypothetical protein